MINVEKQENESTGSLLRRFGRKVKQSSVLMKARAGRHYSRPESSLAKKTKALRRIEKKRKFERLRKLGKTSK